MEFFEVVHTQSSIRRFKPDPVPDEAIWKMIDAGIRAPSGSNTQPWGWLVVRDEEKKRVLADAVCARFQEGGRLQQMREYARKSRRPNTTADDGKCRRFLQRCSCRAGSDYPYAWLV